MKIKLLIAALFMSVLTFAQEISLDGSLISISSGTETCAVYNTGGDLYLDAPGVPGGVILIEDAGRIGLHNLSPATPLHLMQLSGNSDGARGFRIEEASGGHHWTIEINEVTRDLGFYYDGVFKASINNMDGSYDVPMPLVGNSKDSHNALTASTGQENGLNLSNNLDSNLNLSKQVTSQENQIALLIERIEVLEKALKIKSE